MAKEIPSNQKMNDHDLLITLNERVKDLISKVDIFTAVPKADPGQVLDHENRIRRVERWGLLAIGALGLLEFIFRYFPGK